MSDWEAREPVVIAQAVTVLLGTLVAGGWATLDDATVNAVASAVAAVVAVVATVMARRKVTPVATYGRHAKEPDDA